MADKDTQPSVLLLIPAYNEEERIGPVLRDYAEYFRKNYSGKFHAVVVLNGCRDDTLGVVKKVAKEFPEIEPLAPLRSPSFSRAAPRQAQPYA